MMATAGHAVGWPVAAGGSQAITAALAGLLEHLGGTIETGVRVTSLAQLPSARVTLFDTSPGALVSIAGDRLPARTRRAFSRWKYGPAAYKVDLAVEGGIPWTADACRRAGTVHVGGTLEEIAASEADVHRGRMPERPFVLVCQQYLCDPQRSSGDIHPVWSYAHVPNGYDGDATGSIVDQIERFAPGTRERIVARHVTPPAALERYNPNYVGGDIGGGANNFRQLIARRAPRPIPTRPAFRGSTCARRQHPRARGCTGCAATTPHVVRCTTCNEAGGDRPRSALFDGLPKGLDRSDERVVNAVAGCRRVAQPRHTAEVTRGWTCTRSGTGRPCRRRRRPRWSARTGPLPADLVGVESPTPNAFSISSYCSTQPRALA